MRDERSQSAWQRHNTTCLTLEKNSLEGQQVYCPSLQVCNSTSEEDLSFSLVVNCCFKNYCSTAYYIFAIAVATSAEIEKLVRFDLRFFVVQCLREKIKVKG